MTAPNELQKYKISDSIHPKIHFLIKDMYQTLKNITIFASQKQLDGLSLMPMAEEESPGNTEHPTS